MYAVTGATGQLGRLVIEGLLDHVPAEHIVAAVRNPVKAQDLAERGVLVREADYKQPETLRTAFDGVDKLLLISSTEVDGRLPLHRAVIEAAQSAGISLLAYTSMLHADTSSAKLAIEHRLTEQAIASSGLPAVILRNGWYIENHMAAVPAALEHGAFMGAAKQGRFASASRSDYATAAVKVLTSEGHLGKTYELAGDRAFTLSELAAEVARQSGKAVVYHDMEPLTYAKALQDFGLPPDLAALLADADIAASQGALFDDSGTLAHLIGRPTTPWEGLVAAALRG